MIFFERIRQSGRNVERGFGLPKAADVVALTFNSQQPNVRNRTGINKLTAIVEFALGQQMTLKYGIYGLQIEFRRHVADGAIFVVEFFVPIRAFAVAFDEVGEHRPMADHMVAQIHRHKARELQKTGIYPTP